MGMMKSNSNSVMDQELFREYHHTRGMSISGGKTPERKYRFLQNMYVDYEGGGDSVESIPGFRRIYTSEGKIHSVAIQEINKESFIIFHRDNGVYRLKHHSDKAEKIGEALDCESRAFVFKDLCLISDGSSVYMVKGEGDLALLCSQDFITGCSTATVFDGRLFFSGNKDFEGKIFYSSRLDGDSIAFSKDNCISAGGEILSLLNHNDRLWVFRSGGDGFAPITCHNKEDGYPSAVAIGGVYPTGQAISRGRDILFLATDGLWSIKTTFTNEGVSLSRLSSDIEPMLLREDLSSASLCSWCGYAVIGCGEHFYLCDNREVNSECDWYFLSGIGDYVNDRRVYRYSAMGNDEYAAHRQTDGIVKGETLSLINENGQTVFFTEENGRKYSVYPTEERCGGELIAPKQIISDGRLLCFASECTILLFNNDMRGVPPREILCKKDFDEKEYKRLNGHRIHPCFYSFCGHAPSYILATAYDCCGLPATEKTSIGESLCLKLKVPEKADLNISVRTNKGKVSEQTMTATQGKSKSYIFDESSYFLSIAERSHGWVEKQIIIEGCAFSSPFGLYSLSFKYLPKEKIKKG